MFRIELHTTGVPEPYYKQNIPFGFWCFPDLYGKRLK